MKWTGQRSRRKARRVLSKPGEGSVSRRKREAVLNAAETLSLMTTARGLLDGGRNT